MSMGIARQRYPPRRTFGRPAKKHVTTSCDPTTEWLKLSHDDRKDMQCPVDKDSVQARVRRRTGGIETCVLPCGLLFDWLELWKGESLQLVYALALRVTKAILAADLKVAVVAYDNACKLLAMARSKKACSPPETGLLALVRFLLDRFHRDNHHWCLKNMPEVDPETPENRKLLENVNTQGCEQLNNWISDHTRPACGMSESRFAIYWWVMFREHNCWLSDQSAALRRRFARDHMQHDPDKVRRDPRSSRKPIEEQSMNA